MKQPILKRLRTILGLMAAGILCPLLMIEVAVYINPNIIPAEIKSSIFQVDPPGKALILDEELGYKFAPDLSDFAVSFEDNQYTYTISTVSLGYDDIGFRDDGLDGEPFAVVIGDSFANCAGVEMDSCWVELLEDETGKDFANLSVMGYSPQQEYRMLAKYGLPLKPKLVLWVLFANDLKDAWRFDHFGSGAARDNEFWQNPARAWLAQNSAVYTTLSFFWYNRDFFYGLARADDDLIASDPNLIWWLSNTNLAVNEVAQGFELFQTIILDASRLTETQHKESKFVVIILPFREQIYASAEQQTQFDNFNKVITDFLQHNGILVLDLTSALREKARTETEPLYYERDIHLNAPGNAIVAKLLHQQLEMVIVQQ
jgi:hypothetical protein